MPRRKASKPKQATKKSKEEEMVIETSDQEIITSPRKTTKGRRKPVKRQSSFSTDSDLELPFNSPISKLALLKPELSTRTPSKFDTLETLYNRNIMDTGEYDFVKNGRKSIGRLRKHGFNSMDLKSMKTRISLDKVNSNFSLKNTIFSIKIFLAQILGRLIQFLQNIKCGLHRYKALIVKFLWCTLVAFTVFICTGILYKKYSSKSRKPFYTNLEIEETNRDVNFDKYLTPYKEAIKNLETLNYDLEDKLEKQKGMISKLQKELKRVDYLETSASKSDNYFKKLDNDVQFTQQIEKDLEKKINGLKDRVIELESEKNQRSKISTDKELIQNLKLLQEDMETHRVNLSFLNKKIDMSYYGDKTFKRDHALFQHGGRVVGLNSLYFVESSVLNLFAQGLVLLLNLHRRVKNKVINETTNVKGCTPIKIQNAFINVRLSKEIEIKNISYEHLDQTIVVDPSATPKIIHIFGLDRLGKDVFLGEINYERNIESESNGHKIFEDKKSYIQSVAITDNRKYRKLKIKVIENYGHPNYVCLYRIRVHEE